MSIRLTGLVAAVHTPFTPAGDLSLGVVEAQAAHLLKTGVGTAFVGGTTGESHSLTVAERLALAERWLAVVRGTSLRVVVHVGANCLTDGRALAAQAQRLGAAAVAALAPSYFKPRTVADLAACCGDLAAAAPGLPFYYYDIPSLTGVTLPAHELLEVADRVPTLAGVKFTNPDLMGYQLCLRAGGGQFDVPWGTDEALLGALAIGAAGAVGSSYNFAAPVYHRVLAEFIRGDLAAARDHQFRSVRLIRVLAGYGYMAAAKAVMGMLGVPVGPPRLPFAPLGPDAVARMRTDLDTLGFFDWLAE